MTKQKIPFQPRPAKSNVTARGFSLIEVLVAVGVLSLVIYLITTVIYPHLNATNKTMGLSSEQAQIKDMLLKRLDCTQTLQPYIPTATCTGPVALVDKNGKQLISAVANGTRIGKWNVRAMCVPGGITVQTAVFAPGSTTQFQLDPTTQKPLAWNTHSLFPVGAELCQTNFNLAPTPGVLFGGYIFRCPYNSDGAGWVVSPAFAQQRTVPGMPVNLMTGTTDCAPGYTPVSVWGYTDAQCPWLIYCACGWSKVNPAVNGCATSSSDAVGCGEYQYMCLKTTDGSPVPGSF